MYVLIRLVMYYNYTCYKVSFEIVITSCKERCLFQPVYQNIPQDFLFK